MTLRVVDIKKDGIAQTVGNSQTATVVSEVFVLTPNQALYLEFQVEASGVAGTTSVVKMQDSVDGDNFADVGAPAEATIDADGNFRVKLNNGDSTAAAVLPLSKFIRFVATTGVSDALTIDAIRVVLH